MNKCKVIKFSKRYNKLHKQTHATLIGMRIVDLSKMSDEDFEELVEYDAKAEDGSYFPLQRDGVYFLLIFLGNKNIVFQTLRKSEKYRYYNNFRGEQFEIEYINEE